MKRAILVTATAAVGLVAAAAYAAPGDRMAGPGGFMGGPGMCTDADARIAGHLAYAEKRLNITDAQRSAWNKVADAVKAGIPAMKATCETVKQAVDAKEPAPLPERLATMQKHAQQHLEDLSRLQPAVAELYAQLTPEQKKIADSFLARPPHHPGMPGMPGMMERHKGRGGPDAPAPDKAN